MTLLDQAASAAAADYTSSLLQAGLVLALTAALAYLVLRFGGARGLLGPRIGKRVQIEESVRIDPKSSLVIVEVEGRRLLLATHAQGTPRLLVELAPRAGAPSAPERSAP